MKKKSLNAKKIIHNKLLNNLKDPKINSIYRKFEKLLIHNKLYSNLAIGVSGGVDSLALTFLAKCYSILNNSKIKYYHVDHRLRSTSKHEAKFLRSKLKKNKIDCKILVWKGKKPISNLQSIARKNRYKLIAKESLKNKINTILVAHHVDDLYENFLLRLLRGSGLKGLTSLNKYNSKLNESSKINIFRPLINLNKKKLTYIVSKVFNFYIKDSSNNNIIFKRIRIRKLINSLKEEGLDEKKLKMTINNLTDSNLTINYYVKENIRLNSNFMKIRNKFTYMIKNEFFEQPNEVIFRSLTNILKYIGGNYYAPRGKRIVNLINRIKSKNLNKTTLSGCIIEKLNNSWIIYAERRKKIKKTTF